MNKVYACIDGRATTTAVIDWATWAAQRLPAPLELLHVLERSPELPNVGDYTGAIGLGAQEVLLQQLSALDEQRGKLAQQAGREMLEAASLRAQNAGLPVPATHMRHGELVDTLLELEPELRLCVLGANHRASGPRKLHLDHHVESVIRALQRPVLVATSEHFAAPERFVVAYDASPTARKMVDMVAASPLLRGLPALIAMVGADTAEAQEQLAAAAELLRVAGFAVQTKLLPGEPEQALPELLSTQGAALLVMGAYGHSRIRQLIVGSTTTTLLRLSELPVLILR
jgi:nucleotide-binding universal stress UspA family protein